MLLFEVLRFTDDNTVKCAWCVKAFTVKSVSVPVLLCCGQRRELCTRRYLTSLLCNKIRMSRRAQLGLLA